MAVFPPDKIISEFIPYIQKIISTEEDEVLLAISEELPRFKSYLDGKQMTAVLPLFVSLLGCEETVVRESTVEGLRKLVPSFSEEQVQKDLIPMVVNISNTEAFQLKVSACYLIRICYPKAGKEKEKLVNLYFKLCDDDTPIIKRTAAKEFGPLCLIIEKDTVKSEMLNCYKKFMNESDTVRVTILPSIVQLSKIFQEPELQKQHIQNINSASIDKSWRVRNELANLYPQFIDYFQNNPNLDLVQPICTLMKDSETEVKASALKALNQVISKLPSDKVTSQIVPTLRGLNNESNKDTKSNIGLLFGPISRIIGYTGFNANLGTMMDTLMKDENAEVRLGVAKSMYDIFVSSDGSLLSSVNSFLGTMQKDAQYRIRECVYDTLAKLGIKYGLEVFKNNIEGLYFNYLTDNVASVREIGIKSLSSLIKQFGPNWVTSSLIPKLQSHLSGQKISYLNRMCMIHSVCVCAEFLDAKQNTEFIVPILSKGLKDKIPNVRFYTIKLIEKIYKNLDSSSKTKLETSIKSLMSDEDPDVKYFASKFMGGETPK
jgi:serine/threonine-protein phosphatase 2A regulatory subunit A